MMRNVNFSMGWGGGWILVVVAILLGMVVNKPTVGRANGEPVWSPLGPDGGTMFEITADPNNADILFVRSIAGLHRTDDGGESWELILPYYMARGRNPVLIDPSNSNRMMMLLETNGIRFSSDGGFTWNAIGGGFSTTGVAIDAAGVLWATGDDEVFRSDDDGATWTQLTFALNQNAVSVVAHPTIAEKIYVRTPGGGLYVTDDGGATWQPRASLGGFTLEAIDPTTNTLYGIWRGNTNPQGIVKSTDDGVTWVAFDEAIPPQVSSLVVTPTRLYAVAGVGGVFRTTNDGTAWESLAGLPTGGNPNGGQLAVTAGAGEVFYAGGGVYRKSVSDDWVWEASDSGLNARNFQDMAVDPGMVGRIFATDGSDLLYRSEDGGETWVTLKPSFAIDLTTVVFAPSNPAVMYAGTTVDGVYRSDDGGVTWEAANTGIPPEDYDYVEAIAVAPDDPDHLVATLDIGRIYHSTNGGDSWTMAYDHDDQVVDVDFDPHNASIVWVVGESDLLKSTDGGATWKVATTTGFPGNANKYTLAVHPTDGNRLYVSTFISTMSTTQGGMYRSTDGGATWVALATGLPADGRVADIWIDPTEPDTMLIGAIRLVFNQPVPYGYGVYRSTNGGDTWSVFNEGLDHQAVVRLVGRGETVYAASVYGGLWRLGDAPPVITPTPSNTAIPPTMTATATALPPLATCSTVNAPIGTNTPISDTIFPGLTGLVTDLDVIVVVEHSSVGELNYQLSNSQRTVTLFGGASCNGDDIDHIVDDEGNTPIAACANDPAPAYPDGARLVPAAPLSAFDGDLWNAAWHLTIEDNTAGNTGTFVQWCLVPQLVPAPTVTAMPTLTPTPTATGSMVPVTHTPTPTSVPTHTPTATGVPATTTPTATVAVPTPTPTGTVVAGTITPTVTITVPPPQSNALYLPLIYGAEEVTIPTRR